MNQSARLGRIRFAALALFAVLGALCPAAEPTRFVFIADSGNEDSAPGPERKVAAMIKVWKPDFIVAAGDLAYEKGSDEENVFKGDPIACYGEYIKSSAEDPDGTKTRFFPALGNHEYTYAGGGTDSKRLKFYEQTFAVPPGGDGHHYYEVAKGPVRIFILDSKRRRAGTDGKPDESNMNGSKSRSKKPVRSGSLSCTTIPRGPRANRMTTTRRS